MGDIEFPETKNDLDEILQKRADDARLLLIGLRTHDPEIIDAAMVRIGGDCWNSESISQLTYTMSMLPTIEDWSLEDENEKSSLVI